MHIPSAFAVASTQHWFAIDSGPEDKGPREKSEEFVGGAVLHHFP